GGGEVVADGSTIEAPAQPYKVRPANPGGRQVEGTGDTSYEVAEGERIEGQIDTGPPVASTTAAPTASPSPAATSAPAAGGVGVQVGAYSTRAQAEAGWSQLTARFSALQGR